MLIFFVILTLVALGVIVGVIGWRIRLLRGGPPVGGLAPEETPRLGEILGPEFDRFYFAAAQRLKRFGREIFVLSLVAIHKLLLLFKFGLFQLERRFSRLVDAVKGKNLIHKKGSVSVFLWRLKKEK